MDSELERTIGALFHGWMELITMFIIILVVITIFGILYWRSYRPADRGPIVAWPLVLVATALAFLLRTWHADIAAAFIIAGGVIVGGLLSRGVPPISLWIPVMLFAALLGMGFLLSAIIFAVIAIVFLLFSSTRER